MCKRERECAFVFVCVCLFVYFPFDRAVHSYSAKLAFDTLFKSSPELLTTFIQSVPYINYVVDATNDCSN